jgi:hypothetical protein
VSYATGNRLSDQPGEIILVRREVKAIKMAVGIDKHNERLRK